MPLHSGGSGKPCEYAPLITTELFPQHLPFPDPDTFEPPSIPECNLLNLSFINATSAMLEPDPRAVRLAELRVQLNKVGSELRGLAPGSPRAASKSRSQPAMVTERRGADSPSAYEDWVSE